MIRFKPVFSNRSHLVSSAILLLLLAAASPAVFAQTPTLDHISCANTTYSSAGTDSCRAYLTGTTSDQLYIALSSNNPAVQVPTTIRVRLNAASKGFAATIGTVTTAQTATITATLGGVSKAFTISLSPAGTGASALSVNATSIGFGSVILNTPVSQALTLTSTGTTAVTVNSAAVTGAGFSVSGAAFPATLNPGQSLTLEVQFDPTTVGSYSGQLAISGSTSSQTVALSGTGTSHQVDLSWIAPDASSDPIAGYNVYRAPSGTTSYQRLNSSIETQNAYTDSSVAGGSSYVYIVKSVDNSGIESGPSNTTSVIVP